MKYLHYEIDANEGDTVEVRFDRVAFIRLLDPKNFENYKEGRPYQSQGGRATISPLRLAVPASGLWHVIIDLGGGPGHVRATVRLLSGSSA